MSEYEQEVYELAVEMRSVPIGKIYWFVGERRIRDAKEGGNLEYL